MLCSLDDGSAEALLSARDEIAWKLLGCTTDERNTLRTVSLRKGKLTWKRATGWECAESGANIPSDLGWNANAQRPVTVQARVKVFCSCSPEC